MPKPHRKVSLYHRYSLWKRLNLKEDLERAKVICGQYGPWCALVVESIFMAVDNRRITLALHELETFMIAHDPPSPDNHHEFQAFFRHLEDKVLK